MELIVRALRADRKTAWLTERRGMRLIQATTRSLDRRAASWRWPRIARSQVW